jgi:hypothetical protein
MTDDQAKAHKYNPFDLRQHSSNSEQKRGWMALTEFDGLGLLVKVRPRDTRQVSGQKKTATAIVVRSHQERSIAI